MIDRRLRSAIAIALCCAASMLGVRFATAARLETSAPSGSRTAWQPPIGIPRPSFGIAEEAPAVPSPWAAPAAGFYFVNPDDKQATDAGNEFGTPARPRRTIPTSLPAGAVVELHGNYDTPHSSPATIVAHGTAAKPVFIRGVSAAERPRVHRLWEVRGAYAILENLAFIPTPDQKNTGALVIRLPASHMALRFSEVRGTLGGGGLGIVNWETPWGTPYTGTGVVEHIVVYKNFIHDNGDVHAKTDQDAHGISIGDHVHHVWIVDNEIARNSGDGIQINAQPKQGASTHHIFVGRNVSHGNKQTGFWVKYASDVIFSQNVSYGHRPSDSSLGQGMGAQYAPDWVWFLFNEVYDCEYGIAQASDNGESTHTFIIGNVLHNIHRSTSTTVPNSAWAPAAIMMSGGSERHLVGNTIYDVDAGINISSPVGTLELVDNIIANVTVPKASHINLEMSALAGRAVVHHMLYAGEPRAQWGNGEQAAITPAILERTQSVGADPQFVNAARGDFHLTPASPAVGAGTSSAALATFEQRYGLSIALDKDGRSRTGVVDIGAYQLASGRR